jgi:hypothetical protein
MARGRVRVMVAPRLGPGLEAEMSAAVLAGDGADEEEAEAGAFDADGVAAGDSVEALEDALELAGIEAEAGVGDGEGDVGVADDGDGAADVDSGWGSI